MTSDPVRTIAKAVGLSARDIVRIISYAPQRYRVFSIPKRDGVAMRTIAHPSKPLKIIQRYLAREYISQLPVSDAAHAYREGRGIKSNAVVHSKSPVIMKLDFKDFFHSIVPADLLSRLPTEIQENQTTSKIFELSLFWLNYNTKALCLAIGAPSSPMVSNAIMYQIDEAILEAMNLIGVNYTRYADDLTFSGASIEVLEAAEQSVRALIAETKSPRLTLNEKKRGIYTRGMKRMVTGVKLTPQGNVSLGRERKRQISSAVFRAKIGNVSVAQLKITRGWLAFANAVEPEFLDRLRKKYGQVVDRLLRLPIK